MNNTFYVVLNEAKKEAFEIIEDEIVSFHNNLIDAGQAVWNTGNFKNSFSPIMRITPTKWRIENDASYASILARGRRLVNGKWYGSVKWAGGVMPMIEKLKINVERKTNAIRR